MRIFLTLFVNGIAAAVTLVGYLGPQPHDAAFVGTTIAWHILMLAVSVFLMVACAWGTWIIEGEKRRARFRELASKHDDEGALSAKEMVMRHR